LISHHSGFKFSQLEMSKCFPRKVIQSVSLRNIFPSEVVLAVLLQRFVFEPAKDKEIRFNRAGVVWPEVIGGSGKPELPVKISLVERA
jgi:hypothetical protein